MKSFAVVFLLAAQGAAGAPSTVTVTPSRITFAQALEACPSGSLGTISFTLGHLRSAGRAGVDTDIDDATHTSQTVTFSRSGRSAIGTVNAAENTVSAKHVALASRNRVACIFPD